MLQPQLCFKAQRPRPPAKVCDAVLAELCMHVQLCQACVDSKATHRHQQQSSMYARTTR